ncbi:MAG: hypothetical protein ACM3Y9_07850 [Ignavibacteria bacterium]
MSDPLALEERALARGTEVDRASLDTLRGWFPVAVATDPPGLWWRFLGDLRFEAPFFRETLRQTQLERLCCRTSFDALDELGEALEPTALIFHVSRCGSTLLSQLLALLPQCAVISEPPVIDSFLRFHAAAAGGAERTLRGLVAALGQKRFPQEQRLFVKLDSWHIHELSLFRRAFPRTPFIFVYREPAAVMASHRRQRGPQMVPGVVTPARLGIGALRAAAGDLDAYCAQVLEGFMSAALASADDLVLLDYRELPEVVWARLLKDFSLDCDAAQMDVLEARARRHSKDPARGFAGDPPSSPATADLAAADRLYAELGRKRLLQIGGAAVR